MGAGLVYFLLRTVHPTRGPGGVRVEVRVKVKIRGMVRVRAGA